MDSFHLVTADLRAEIIESDMVHPLSAPVESVLFYWYEFVDYFCDILAAV